MLEGKIESAKGLLLKALESIKVDKSNQEARLHMELVLGEIYVSNNQFAEGDKLIEAACQEMAPKMMPTALLDRFESELLVVNPDTDCDAIISRLANGKDGGLEYADALLALGKSAVTQRKFENARQLLNKALEFHSGFWYYRSISAQCYELLARCDIALNDFDQARVNLDKAAQLAAIELSANHPVAADVLVGRASVCIAQGDKSKAKGYYTRAIEIMQRSIGKDSPRTQNLERLSAEL